MNYLDHLFVTLITKIMTLIRIPKIWQIPENQVTSEKMFFER
jgi:hypothetical protein